MLRPLRCAVFLLVTILVVSCVASHTPLSLEKMPKVAGDVPRQRFNEVWKMIISKYVDLLPDTPQARKACFEKIRAGGLSACLNDSHSYYLPKSEIADFQKHITGSYSGIGLEISESSAPVKIVGVIKNSPAEKSGVFQVGDIIVAVNGKDVSKKSSDAIRDMIRGEAGTHVTIRVEHNGRKQDPIVLMRENIMTYSVHAKDIGSRVTYIKIDRFNMQTPGEFFGEIMTRVTSISGNGVSIDRNARKFIYDLRRNPGGLVEAVGMMSYLFADNPNDIVLTTRSQGEEESYLAGGFMGNIKMMSPGIFRRFKAVLLIDGGSASAAEIFAAFVHEATGAPRIGTRSHGKGSVQQVFYLRHGDAVSLTVAEYFVGKGKIPINRVGIKPEYEVSGSKISIEEGELVDPENDPQVKKAIEILQALDN